MSKPLLNEARAVVDGVRGPEGCWLSTTRPSPACSLTLDERHMLRSLAVGHDVLEVGAYYGVSTLLLAEAAALVVSVDHHRGDELVGHHDTLSEYLRVIAPVRDKVITVLASSSPALSLLAPGTFSLVFVDGGHDRETAAYDLRAAQMLVTRGGWIAAHDWNLWGVAAGWDDAGLPEPSEVIDTLALVQQ